MERKSWLSRVKFPKIFFGWWTVIAGGVLALWGYGYQAYGISALFKPISAELNFSRTATSVAAAIGRFEGGFEAPVVGWIVDRFGPRWVVFVGVLILSAGLVLMYYINSLWAYYVVWGVLVGTGANIALSIPVDAAISNWFVKKRGIALSIKWMASGLSGVVALPFIAWLINIQGWRMCCVTGGLVMAIIGLPLAWFCVKQRRPEYYGILPDGAKVKEELTGADQFIEHGVRYAAEVQEVEFTVAQVVKTRAYWMMVAANALTGLVTPAINLHCIPFLTDVGIDPLAAAGMMVVMIGAGVPARIVAGYLADRIKIGYMRFLLGGTFIMMLAGIGVFLFNQSILMIYIWFILYGIGSGASYAVHPLFRARYFGRKAFGTIQGVTSLILTPIGVAAPIYAGWVYDTTGSYMTAFTVFTVLLAVATAVIAFAAPPKPPAVIGDIRKIV